MYNLIYSCMVLVRSRTPPSYQKPSREMSEKLPHETFSGRHWASAPLLRKVAWRANLCPAGRSQSGIRMGWTSPVLKHTLVVRQEEWAAHTRLTEGYHGGQEALCTVSLHFTAAVHNSQSEQWCRRQQQPQWARKHIQFRLRDRTRDGRTRWTRSRAHHYFTNCELEVAPCWDPLPGGPLGPGRLALQTGWVLTRLSSDCLSTDWLSTNCQSCCSLSSKY